MDEGKTTIIKTETIEDLCEVANFDIPIMQSDKNMIHITVNANESTLYYENETYIDTISIKQEKEEDYLTSVILRVNPNSENTTEPTHIDLKQENEKTIISESNNIKEEREELLSVKQDNVFDPFENVNRKAEIMFKSTEPPQFPTSDSGTNNMNIDLAKSEVKEQCSNDDGRDPLDISDLEQVQQGKIIV